MRALAQGFDDDGRHVRLGQPHDVGRQQPFDDQDALLGNRFEPGLRFSAEPPNDVSSQVEHVVGALAQRLVFERLEFLIPPLENSADGPLRGQQRSSDFPLEFTRFDQASQHCAMRAKDARQCRVEFRLDPLCRLVQLGKRFCEGMREAIAFAVRGLGANRLRNAVRSQRVSDDPGVPHSQARRNAPSGQPDFL